MTAGDRGDRDRGRGPKTTDVNEVNVHGNGGVGIVGGLVVQCTAGFDGGLPQTFLLEVRHEGRDLIANQSVASRPYFKVSPFLWSAIRRKPGSWEDT